LELAGPIGPDLFGTGIGFLGVKMSKGRFQVAEHGDVDTERW